MPELVTLEPDVPVDRLLGVMRRDGAAIVAGLLPASLLGQVIEETTPFVERSPNGRDDFTGRSTTRTGALVARSPACRSLVMDRLVVTAAQEFLGPHTNRIQLHLTQVIRLRPGQPRQTLHRDRLAWGGYIPRQIEPQFNTIWALTDFTELNGATRVVPGSQEWPDDRRAAPEEITQATMNAGSVLFYSGSVVHGGGENRSTADRIGVNITYCLAWLRSEENQYLSCPPDVARDLDPELQDLLGYTMANYALGYYSDPTGVNPANDILPPEFAIGAKPRGRDANSLMPEGHFAG